MSFQHAHQHRINVRIILLTFSLASKLGHRRNERLLPEAFRHRGLPGLDSPCDQPLCR